MNGPELLKTYNDEALRQADVLRVTFERRVYDHHIESLILDIITMLEFERNEIRKLIQSKGSK